MGHSAWNETYDASGKAAIEIAATTLEGAVLFKWVDKPATWWQWMLDHSKDLSIPPVIPPVDPPVEPKPEITWIVGIYSKTYPTVDSVFFTSEDGKRIFILKVDKKIIRP
jgi:hypothetical protein